MTWLGSLDSPSKEVLLNPERKKERAPQLLDAAAFRAIAEFTYDWESWVGVDGRVIWLNGAVLRIAGYSVEECLSMEDYPLPLVYPEDRERLAQVSRSAEAGGSANHVEFRILRKDGTARWGAISYQSIFDAEGNRLGYRSSVRDIDERKEMEARLRELVEQAEQANRAKTEFLAKVSHELRTPLQSLVTHAELLERAPIGEENRRYASSMIQEGRHLERLVLDLLDYAALSAGELTIVSTIYSPTQQFAPRLLGLSKAAQEKGLEFRVKLPESSVLVEGDADRALQILTNLAKNAVEYTQSGRVEVAVETSGGRMKISVTDTGPGLPQGLDLFEPFRRGSTGAITSGFGLGLAITSRLAFRMGGGLRAESVSVGGTQMVAEFDVMPVDNQSSRSLRALDLPVLVIDDVTSVREALVTTLRSMGHEALGVPDPKAGVEFLEQTPRALVLLDQNIPGTDALENAEHLRAVLHPEGRLLGMSASPLTRSQNVLEQAGLDGFLLKPIRREQIEALLRGDLDAHFAAFQKQVFFAVAAWDLDRLKELGSTRDAEGRSLLVRLLRQLELELPRLLAQLSTADSDPNEAFPKGAPRSRERALHDLAGVAGLVGAKSAYEFFISEEEKARSGQAIELAEVERVAIQFLYEFRRHVH
jgi:PAS domain S-box-containing protein